MVSRFRGRGFTLVELLTVMAIVALLLSIAVPRYFQSLDRSRDTVLQENLRVMRETIDKFYGDQGRYPESLDELVDRKYLKAVPQDPVTERRDSWVAVRPADPLPGALADVKSGAPGKAHDGRAYADF